MTIDTTNDNPPLVAERSELAYFDQQTAKLNRQVTPLQAWNTIMADPIPLLNVAFWIRNTISGLFGVKRIAGFSQKSPRSIEVGDKLDFFLVEAVSANTLVFTERDSHLDVMTTVQTANGSISITSSVVTHNLFGALYMIPVGIAHPFLVRAMIRRLQKSLTDRVG